MSSSSGPVLRLLASALRLWVLRQCEAVESLELELEGSTMGLLAGRLEGVRVAACRVRFQGLEIEEVRLRSAPIQVQRPNLLRGQALQLEQAFAVEGLVRLSGDGLEHSLTGDTWRPLGDQLAEALLGTTPLLALRTRNTRLVLTAQPDGDAAPREVEAVICAEQGTIALQVDDPAARLVLPMDPAIHIARAEVKDGMVVLEGQARVSP